MTRSIIQALAAITLAIGLTACTTPAADPEVAASTTSPAPADEQREVDLRYVSPQTASCTQVWSVGAVLPEDYEWCQDDEGNAVAGVRIGSCEVVVHGNELYAVPGRRITAIVGSPAQDSAYADSLTACKRSPYPRETR